MVKNLPAMQEMQIQHLGGGRFSGEGNGNPLQHSCLEDSMDRGYSPWGRKESDLIEHIHIPHEML